MQISREKKCLSPPCSGDTRKLIVIRHLSEYDTTHSPVVAQTTSPRSDNAASMGPNKI